MTLSDAAVAKLTELTKEEADPNVGLRVYVYSGGCSGYRYGMMLEDQPAEEDVKVESKGINVYVDPQSTQLAEGFRDRLRGHAHGCRLHGQQPQRRLRLRLRQQLPHRGVGRRTGCLRSLIERSAHSSTSEAGPSGPASLIPC